MSHSAFKKSIIRFGTTARRLHANGMKYKEIASTVGIYPSVLSEILNKLIPQIDQNPSIDIREAFADIRIISFKTLHQKIDLLVTKIESIDIEAHHVDQHLLQAMSKQFMESTQPSTMSYIQGIYDCYYVSSNGYRVKREPLMIRCKPNLSYALVSKGNILSDSLYEGEVYCSNSQLLTMQLLEKKGLTVDHFIAHILLPPSFSIPCQMLKGMSISLSNSVTPIARKVVLDRITKRVNIDDYNALETTYFDINDDHNPIVRYLYDMTSILEYMPVPQSKHSTDDLEKEKLISSMIQLKN